jgi:hypothetical protein
MSEMNDEAPRDGEVRQGSATPDPPTVRDSALLENSALENSVLENSVLESAMATGEDEGTPGERGPIDPSDTTAIEVADDAPDLSGNGGPQGDGLEPRFREPTD